MDAIIRVPSGSDLVPILVLITGVISQLEDWPELCEKILPNLIKPENSDVDLSSWRILTMWTIICVGAQESTTQHFGEKRLKYIVPVGA